MIQHQFAVEVSAASIRDALSNILSSAFFPASSRRRKFLRYVVEEALAGRADRLKGFSIAVAVFDRDKTFDPQSDPVVRLEAGRLRRDLDSYYVDAGANDTVRISIPRGSYVPNFEYRKFLSSSAAPADPERASETARDHLGTRSVTQKAHVPLDVAANVPNVVVRPFASLSTGDDARYFALGISQELVSNLFLFPGLRLYASPVAADDKFEGAPAEQGTCMTYVVTGSVRSSPTEIRITTQVTETRTGQIVWAKTYSRPTDPALFTVTQADLASEIATAIGQPYGVVTNDIRARSTALGVAAVQSYASVLKAYGYRRNFRREDHAAILRSLEEAVERDPEYSDAWAMLGWLHVDAARLGYGGETNSQPEYQEALHATSRAVSLQPENPLAQKALAAAYYYAGRYDDSERTARRAVSLNPHDPEALAQLGWRLAARGNFDEGIDFLKRAIVRTVNPPGWYYHLVAVDLYLKGDYQQMLEVAKKALTLPDSSGFGFLLLALANSELGQEHEAKQALELMSQNEAVARDPEGYMRRHGTTGQIADALMAGLRKAQRCTSA